MFLEQGEVESMEDLVIAKSRLQQIVNVRNQMGGAMYWNILNDEAVQVANKCVSLGADRTEISSILGPGTHA